MGIENLFGGGKKTSKEDIVRAQEAAAKAEKERLATETAQKEAQSQKIAQENWATAQSKRQALVSSVVTDDEEQRRKYLKAV